MYYVWIIYDNKRFLTICNYMRHDEGLSYIFDYKMITLQQILKVEKI